MFICHGTEWNPFIPFISEVNHIQLAWRYHLYKHDYESIFKCEYSLGKKQDRSGDTLRSCCKLQLTSYDLKQFLFCSQTQTYWWNPT